MPRLCMVCAHPQRQQIDEELLRHRLSYRGIARRYGLLGNEGLRRHERNHLAASFHHNQEVQAMLSAENLLARLAILDERTLALLTAAEARGDVRNALAAIRESRHNTEAFARIVTMGALIEASTPAAVPPPITLPAPSPQHLRETLRILIAAGAAFAKDGTPDTESEDIHAPEQRRPIDHAS